jgi:hypothetical protein
MRKKDWLHLMRTAPSLSYPEGFSPTPFSELLPPALGRESTARVESDRLAGIEMRQPIERLNVAYFRERAARFRQLAALVSDDTLTREMMELAAAYEARASQLEVTKSRASSQN